MIFLTVGTTHPFDRLVKGIDQAVESGVIDETVFAQIGDGAYQPRRCQFVRHLDKTVFEGHMRDASCVISHAGMGVLTLALEHRKPTLVMPRRKRYGEVVNDHQSAIARHYAAAGHVLVAWEENDLPRQLGRLRTFIPAPREPHTEAVIERVTRFLQSLQSYRR